ncbi:MAG: cadherin-like beta sandwich domain-containing protein, partial [Spirochaetes bacterium]|nr:cadherin-like beta sandwich domain-containing protein [Spirochaetota bacterium]
MKKKVILFRFLFFVLPVLFIWSCTIIGEPPFVSNDSALDNLTINGLAVYDDKLAFSKTTLSYSLTLYYPTSNITITPRASDEAFATLMVNGVLQFSRVTSGSISLPVGTTNIPIQLVAEDKTTNTYMLSITRKDSNSTPPTIQINTGSMAGDQTIRVKLRVYNIADSESPVTLRIVVNSTNTNDILNAQVAGVYTNFVTVPPGAGNTIAVYAIDADNNSTQAAGSPVTVTTTLNRLNIFSENDSGNDFDWKNDRLDPTAQGDAFQDSWSRSTGGLTSPPS